MLIVFNVDRCYTFALLVILHKESDMRLNEDYGERRLHGTRPIFWIMTAIALLATFAACRGGSKHASEHQDSDAKTQEGPVVISFWYAYGGKNRQVTEAMIRDFNSSHPDIRVSGTFQGDYFQSLAKLRVAARTDGGPVVTHVVGEALPALWKAGILEDMEPYAAGTHGHSPLDKDDFIPALTQDGYFDYGNAAKAPLFSLPFNRSTPIAYYNKRLLNEAGLKPPTTWEELRSHAKTLSKDAPEQRWGFEAPIDWWFWVAMLYQNGGTLMNAQGAPSFAEGGESGLSLWTSMIHEDKSMKHPPGRDYNAWEATNTDFLNERVAMIWTSTAFLAYFDEHAKFDFGTAYLPAKSKSAVPTGGTFFVMSKKKTQAEKNAAWTFLTWMTAKEQTIRWSQKTGYMPVRKSALETAEMKAFYDKHPDYRTAMDQLEHAIKFPFSEHLIEVQRKIVQPNLERPVVQKADPADVLKKAEAEASALKR